MKNTYRYASCKAYAYTAYNLHGWLYFVKGENKRNIIRNNVYCAAGKKTCLRTKVHTLFIDVLTGNFRERHEFSYFIRTRNCLKRYKITSTGDVT